MIFNTIQIINKNRVRKNIQKPAFLEKKAELIS